MERLSANIAAHNESNQLFYRPTLEPIRTAINSVSSELIAYLANNPNALHALRPKQFEELIAEILSRFGWQVELTPESKDGGYDILGVTNVAGGIRSSYIVECKKYASANEVGVEVARQLLHVKSEKKVSHAMIVTTSDFTKGVYDFQANRLDFDTRNFDAVVEWCTRHSADQLT